MFRHFIFRNYYWIAILLCSIAITFIYFISGPDRNTLAGASVAGTLSFCYFVQQQKLAETQLFHTLFSDFNKRYDRLNNKLDLIARKNEAITQTDRNWIVDYFNLCAEEYLFYKEGYIHHDVWRSWCRGMLWHLERPKFRDVWDEEINMDSFYGLSIEKIKLGAALGKHETRK